jgi:3-dehydroquinate synthase
VSLPPDFTKPSNTAQSFGNENFRAALENFLHAQIAFKAEIVCQDEREAVSRTDAKSRKILNFGHTTAHALERATDYRYFKHGEAVGYGIRVAAELSKSVGIFDENELKLLNDVLLRVGSPPDARNVNLEQVFEAFSTDKKKRENSLEWILLKRIGKPKIVSMRDIPEKLVKEALTKVLKK